MQEFFTVASPFKQIPTDRDDKSDTLTVTKIWTKTKFYIYSNKYNIKTDQATSTGVVF